MSTSLFVWVPLPRALSGEDGTRLIVSGKDSNVGQALGGGRRLGKVIGIGDSVVVFETQRYPIALAF